MRFQTSFMSPINFMRTGAKLPLRIAPMLIQPLNSEEKTYRLNDRYAHGFVTTTDIKHENKWS
jgi:hypothetical protein